MQDLDFCGILISEPKLSHPQEDTQGMVSQQGHGELSPGGTMVVSEGHPRYPLLTLAEAKTILLLLFGAHRSLHLSLCYPQRKERTVANLPSRSFWKFSFLC